MKNNLEHSALPSADEIQLYQEGKLEALRSHEIEILAQENPLLADALEGYVTVPSYAMLPLINASIAQSTGLAAGTATTGSAAAVKAGTAWWHFNGWIIGVVAGSTAAVSVAVVMNISKEEIAQSTDKNQSITHQESSVPEIENIENAASVDQSTATPFTTISENNQVTAAQQQQQQQQSNIPTTATVEANEASNLMEDATTTPEDPAVAPTVQTVSNETSAEVELPKKSSTVAISIKHILNYRVADYTAIRVKGWEKFSLDDVGLPANFGSSAERQKFLEENPERSVPYLNYITDCIKAYDEDKFKLSLQRFAVVLSEYPEDVNAQFYSAMSLYRTGEYDKAIALFTKVEKNHINTFNEEAMFYHAKSLQQSGKTDEATSLFVKVVQKNGFYKEQAIKEMQ